MIPEAEATGRCEVRSESYVFRLATARNGRISGVHYFDRNRHEHFQKARAVVVCANGAETPRLLLMSANAQFPDGLANSSGLVGKHLMFNQGAETYGVFEHELNEYKSVQATRVVHDFYDADPKRGFYGGGGIDARIGPNPAAWTLSGPPGRQWGKTYKDHLRTFPRTMLARRTRHRSRSRPRRVARSRAQRRVGYAGDALHLHGSPGRSQIRRVAAGPRRRDPGGCRCTRDLARRGRRIDDGCALAWDLSHGK